MATDGATARGQVCHPSPVRSPLTLCLPTGHTSLCSVCLIAGDISPIDVITPLPVLCEDNDVPYIYVPSKASSAAVRRGQAGGSTAVQQAAALQALEPCC